LGTATACTGSTHRRVHYLFILTFTRHPPPLSTITPPGVELSDGTRVDARVVLVNADPFRLRQLTGHEQFSPDFNTWLDSLRKDGTTMKVGGGGVGGQGEGVCVHRTAAICT